MQRAGWAAALGLVLSLVSTGCYRGYKSAEELEKDERGPTQCAQSCSELGMRMGAFVLVEHAVSGCVCEPVPLGPPVPPAAAPMPPLGPSPGPALSPEQQVPPPESSLYPPPRMRGAVGAAAAQFVLIVAQQRAAAQQYQQQQQTQTFHR